MASVQMRSSVERAGEGCLVDDDELTGAHRRAPLATLVQPLGGVLGGDAEVVGEFACGGSGRCEPDDRATAVLVLPRESQRMHRRRLAGTGRPDQHIERARRGCDRLEGRALILPEDDPVIAACSLGVLEGCSADDWPVGRMRRGEQSLLRIQESDRRVSLGVPRAEDARAICTSELGGRDRQFGRREPHGAFLGGIRDHADDRLAVLGCDEAPSHRLPRGFGVQVPATPRRTALARGLDHARRDLVQDAARHVLRAQQHRRIRIADRVTRPSRRVAAEQSTGTGAPLVREVGERSELLLRAGRECRLLAQPDDRHLRRSAAVRGYVLVDEPVLLDVDVTRARRELGDEMLWHTA